MPPGPRKQRDSPAEEAGTWSRSPRTLRHLPGVTAETAAATSRARLGTVLAAVGVLAFSGSFPATVYAMRGLDPFLVSIGRAVLALVVAARIPADRPRPAAPAPP